MRFNFLTALYLFQRKPFFAGEIGVHMIHGLIQWDNIGWCIWTSTSTGPGGDQLYLNRYAIQGLQARRSLRRPEPLVAAKALYNNRSGGETLQLRALHCTSLTSTPKAFEQQEPALRCFRHKRKQSDYCWLLENHHALSNSRRRRHAAEQCLIQCNLTEMQVAKSGPSCTNDISPTF